MLCQYAWHVGTGVEFEKVRLLAQTQLRKRTRSSGGQNAMLMTVAGKKMDQFLIRMPPRSFLTWFFANSRPLPSTIAKKPARARGDGSTHVGER